MAFVIEARKIQGNGTLRRYFIDSGKGESRWIKKRFEAKSYPTDKKAKQAKNMLGEQTVSSLSGSGSGWKISIKRLKHNITDQEMRTLANECLDHLTERTGLTIAIAKKKLKDIL